MRCGLGGQRQRLAPRHVPGAQHQPAVGGQAQDLVGGVEQRAVLPRDRQRGEPGRVEGVEVLGQPAVEAAALGVVPRPPGGQVDHRGAHRRRRLHRPRVEAARHRVQRDARVHLDRAGVDLVEERRQRHRRPQVRLEDDAAQPRRLGAGQPLPLRQRLAEVRAGELEVHVAVQVDRADQQLVVDRPCAARRHRRSSCALVGIGGAHAARRASSSTVASSRQGVSASAKPASPGRRRWVSSECAPRSLTRTGAEVSDWS